MTRTQIQSKGIVQDVGFRPFVFALAKENSLKGQVYNNSNGVLIDVGGGSENIEQFINPLKTYAPLLSVIESVYLPKHLGNRRLSSILNS